MPPYGKAYGVLTDREILDKCTLRTCEWLTRPATAISEMANSLYDNLATLKAYEGKVFEKSAVTFLASKLVPLKHSLQRFNKKDTTGAEEPDDDDMCTLMKTISQDTLSEMSKELFAASGAMYQMATQMMVLQTLLRHPDVWAAKHREMQEVAAFKANPSPEGMRDYLKTQILQSAPMATQSSRTYSVWDTPTQPATASNIQGSSAWEDDPEDLGEGTSRENPQGPEEQQG